MSENQAHQLLVLLTWKNALLKALIFSSFLAWAIFKYVIRHSALALASQNQQEMSLKRPQAPSGFAKWWLGAGGRGIWRGFWCGWNSCQKIGILFLTTNTAFLVQIRWISEMDKHSFFFFFLFFWLWGKIKEINRLKSMFEQSQQKTVNNHYNYKVKSQACRFMDTNNHRNETHRETQSPLAFSHVKNYSHFRGKSQRSQVTQLWEVS